MARIEDLVDEVPDARLRKALSEAVRGLKESTAFGLVFEEHLPETLQLPSLPIRPGVLVTRTTHDGANEVWEVKRTSGRSANCARTVDGLREEAVFPLRDLAVTKRFGDPIYPA